MAPLRLRLTLAFAGAMALVLALVGGYVYQHLASVWSQAVDQDLRARTEVVLGAVGTPGARPLDSGTTLLDPDEAFAQVHAADGAVLQTTSAVASAGMLTPAEVRAVTGPTFFTRRVRGVGDPARLLAAPAQTDDGPVVVVVGATLGDRNDALTSLREVLLTGGPVALLLASFGAWLLAGAALRPVNELLAAQRASVEREHRFVAEASHELRTPLAVLKGELELATSRPRTAAELGAAIEAAHNETDRLVALAEDLLVLARSRAGSVPLHRVDVDLADVLASAVDDVRPRAQSAGVLVELRATSEQVRLDPVRMRQAVHNLLDNAVRHGRGCVTVTGERQDGMVVVTVSDRGVGFPADCLERAFDPFVRGSSTSDAPRGSGLGLAIVQAVAEAHGGSARIVSGGRIGAVVEMRLPG